jgi:hypothetical protein
MADIRALLASHADSAHDAGHARTKELTGARVCVMRGDDAAVASGGSRKYLSPLDLRDYRSPSRRPIIVMTSDLVPRPFFACGPLPHPGRPSPAA